MKIIEHDWGWASPLTRRSGPVHYIVVHHAAGDLTAKDVHRVHLGKGWSGIGYHYVVELDGDIHCGRPEWAVGAHVNEHNHEALGVCFSGNYETRKVMPRAQLDAGKALLADLQRRYPNAQVRRHKDMPDNATACPGRHFPFEDIKGEKVEPKPKPKVIDKKLRPALKQRMLRYAIAEDIQHNDCLALAMVNEDGRPNTEWGDAAKRLAWRISGRLKGVKQSTQPTVELWKALGD